MKDPAHFELTDEHPISPYLIVKLVEERKAQRLKFGHEPLATTDGFIRIAGEEFGEICRAINQRGDECDWKREALQLAAVCIAMLDGDLHDGNQK